MFNHELVANFTFFTNVHQTLTINPYIKYHKNNKENIEQSTIKFDMGIKANKNIVVNHNFTVFMCILNLIF